MHHKVTVITKANARFDFRVASDIADSFKSILKSKNKSATLVFHDRGLNHQFKVSNIAQVLIGDQMIYSAN